MTLRSIKKNDTVNNIESINKNNDVILTNNDNREVITEFFYVPGDYKANRKKDDTLNMTNIYKSMEDLLEILKSRGFFSMAIDRAEADDLAALFKKHI
jgi:hypothetical protein